MTLDEFVAQVQREITQFSAHWHAQREKGTEEHWPLEMGEPDWYEQLLFFTRERPS
jgi:hypothetical protein